jgi:DNA polymerase-3 subunit beta
MTVEVERDALLATVRAVADVVESRNTIPILSNLLIEVASGTLTVTGTDLDIQASASCEAAGEMLTTVDRNKLVAAVTSLKPGRVTIAPVEGRGAVTLAAGRGKRTLSTLPAADFPQRKAPENARIFNLSAASLMRLLDSCHVAQSTEEVRYYLCGIFFHVVDHHLVGAATDGHRMIRAQVPLPEGAAGMADIIVPTKAVTLMRKLLGKREGEVRVSVTDREIEVKAGPLRVTAKLIDGTFPDYSRVIPPASDNKLTVGRDVLIDGVGAVASVVNAEGEQKVRTVKVELVPGDTQMLSALDTTGASAVEELPAGHAGNAVTFGVNHRYLTSVAGIFTENGMLSISIDGERSPMRIEGDKDPDLVAVVMPMRV